MPFIEESDLLDLHKDIEKAQLINERLLDQIKYKNNDLKKLKIQQYVLIGMLGILIIIGLGTWAFFSGANASRDLYDRDLVASSDSLQMARAKIDVLAQENEKLSFVREFYLARKFLENRVIYSVQVKSLVDRDAILASEALTNTLLVRNNEFYAYSIGTFEDIEDARALRRKLVEIGFKDAFVASYKDGQRIKIESPD